jgi:alkanesulfonate monooxygenase SsuD/methylene tetrahydromethanopterin reductase-like flavin-dependent oxidoreductase (luciferase family)
MDLGIGLPTTVPGVTGKELVRWAAEAEDLGFSSLGALDRLVYPSTEPIIALTAAAAVTYRVRLTTTVLVAAYRGNTALLAKQLASLQEISGGRLAVGVAAGGRDDDFALSHSTYHDRGHRLDAMLAELGRLWQSKDLLVPASAYGPPAVLAGGHSPAALRRAARHANGWIMGGGSAAACGQLAQQLRELWKAEKREGQPYLAAIVHVALGKDARAQAEDYLLDFYAHAGPHAARVVQGLLDTEAALHRAVGIYEAAGFDELILFPSVPRRKQLTMTAKALLPRR